MARNVLLILTYLDPHVVLCQRLMMRARLLCGGIEEDEVYQMAADW